MEDNQIKNILFYGVFGTYILILLITSLAMIAK